MLKAPDIKCILSFKNELNNNNIIIIIIIIC